MIRTNTFSQPVLVRFIRLQGLSVPLSNGRRPVLPSASCNHRRTPIRNLPTLVTDIENKNNPENKMGGRIECYLDITSMYSYLGFLELLKNQEVLASHNVEIEYHPVLLGAINSGSGNKPPWMLPAKATYLVYDMQRSISRFPGLVLQTPEDLMAVSMSVAVSIHGPLLSTGGFSEAGHY